MMDLQEDDWSWGSDGSQQAQNELNQPDQQNLPSDELEEEEPQSPHACNQLGHQDNFFTLVSDSDVALLTAFEGDDSFRRPAFNESPKVQLAYLHAAIGNVYEGLTIKQSENSFQHYPQLSVNCWSPPRSPSANAVITQYYVCPACWKYHSPAEVEELKSPICIVSRFNGVVFDETQNRKGQRKHEPCLVISHTSIIETLQGFFMCPGFATKIRDS
ncbi:hypothetical protein E1B28_003016 [Marasmius oreades]|uniref:Uncharacterized protein n=1 Tax=Marasmius oreades TaxID=181124 RepID=A0A9P7RKU8_9AGAR|nr:uncharacterized protein E1B28_003016 [Marasmius oreades]KAG7085455.1 hypothetical protein E1B28_003016 [Marasmius oreades]